MKKEEKKKNCKQILVAKLLIAAVAVV